MQIEYAVNPELTAEEFISVLRRSTLGERRPVDDVLRMSHMVANAGVIVTARHEGLLVGVSRAITDFVYCTYLSDLAVDTSYQRHGIGREMIQRTHQAAGLATRLILIAAPAARSYYPHIGMKPHDSCWMIDPVEESR
jgi:GNAT superfamily N-acetyltransferase